MSKATTRQMVEINVTRDEFFSPADEGDKETIKALDSGELVPVNVDVRVLDLDSGKQATASLCGILTQSFALKFDRAGEIVSYSDTYIDEVAKDLVHDAKEEIE